MEPDGSRQYDPTSGYSSARGLLASSGSSRGGSSSGASEAFRHSHMQMPPTPTSIVGASTGSTRVQGAGGYSYTQGQQQYAPQMHDTSISYRSGDYAQDAQRQQQQSFPTYSSNLIYNIPSQIQQQPTGYDVQQQFQPRQSAGIDVQFNVPQYYNTGDATSGAGPSQQNQYVSSTAFQQDQYSSSPNRASGSPYTAGLTEFAQMDMSSMLERPDPTQQGRRSSEDQFVWFLEMLKNTFRDTQQGRLDDAGRRLLRLSDWISGQAVDLELYNERLDFWNQFNTCWLSVLQKHKDIYQSMVESGQPPIAGQTLLQEDLLERMGRELVRMCDGLERHGLVDYQMGVWEEEIMNVLLECIQLLENELEEPGSSGVSESRRSTGRSIR